MASFTLQGTLHDVLDTQDVSATFRKREFVVAVTEQGNSRNFMQLIKFEATQDRCDLLDSFRPGEPVEVAFNLKGREWVSPKGEKKYFTTLDAWRVQRAGNAGSPPPPPPTDFDGPTFLDEDAGDLPF
ncbi:MAG: DUF3127 domain-containing protein [Bacteroidetes bacterium]|nr:DUF3127 domain-containing protein [Bacteroidota bacterium]